MAKKKAENTKTQQGLTVKQEMFCQFYADELCSLMNGDAKSTKGAQVKAYRRAYNCQGAADWQYREASLLMKDPKISHRIDELKKELLTERTITRERIVTRNVLILEGDNLVSMKQLPDCDEWAWRGLNEIPLKYRKLVKPLVVNNTIVWVLDKKLAEDRLMKLLGLDNEQTLNVNYQSMAQGRYIFDDED